MNTCDTCGLDKEKATTNWVKLNDYDGCCDGCGNPMKFPYVIVKYEFDFNNGNNLMHRFKLKNVFMCLGCNKYVEGVNVYCGGKGIPAPSLFINTQVPVLRENENDTNTNLR